MTLRDLGFAFLGWVAGQLFVAALYFAQSFREALR